MTTKNNKGKDRYEIECECKQCSMKFVIWDLENEIKEIDSGLHISKLFCPNGCGRTLDFDLLRRRNPY